MRWLLTTRPGVDRGDLDRELAPLGVTVDDAVPIPSGDEQVFTAEGPRDLPALLERRRTQVIAVYPDSEPEPA